MYFPLDSAESTFLHLPLLHRAWVYCFEPELQFPMSSNQANSTA